MPQAVAFVAAAVTAFATGGTIAGVSAAVTAGTLGFGASLLYGAVEVGLYVGLSLVFNALFGPKPPPTAAVSNPIKSGFSPRRCGFGRSRTSGTYVLFEAKDGVAYQVLAMHDGFIDGWERYWLHDDEVEVDAGTGGVWCPSDTRKYAYGGPPGDRCFIQTSVGHAAETAFSRPSAGLPAIWGSTHRGDRVASLALTCKQSKAKYQQEDFPNGLPIPSACARWQQIFDPRDGGQSEPLDFVVANETFMAAAQSTWLWSDNPVLALLSYLTTAKGGMALSYEQCILPAIDSWIAAADLCDELVSLDAGGTEKRYRLGGMYNRDTDPAEVISQILSSFDGWLGMRGDGAFVLKGGVYEAPTVTLTDDHVTAYTVQHFSPDEEAVNEVVPSFTNPLQYTNDDAGALRNEPDIAARGVVRSKAIDYQWVQSKTQAQRLGKRVLNRGAQELRGTVSTNFSGLKALGERYLTLSITENAALTDLVVEVSRIEMDLPSLTINIDWIQADPTIDDWDPAEETVVSVGGDRQPGAPLTAPTITSITPVYDQASAADNGARLSIAVSSPLTADVQWLVRWRPNSTSPAGAWTEGSYSDIADGASVVLETGFVPAHDTLSVEVAYITAGQISPWSATFTVTTDAPFDAFVDGLTGVVVGAVDNGDGTVTISGAIAALTAGEALSAGNLVTIQTSAGVAKMFKANATDMTKPAMGFVKAAVSSGATGTFYGPGTINTAVSGLTAGATYFLSTTGGGVTTTAPSTSGNSDQQVGVALSTTKLLFDPKIPVEAP